MVLRSSILLLLMVGVLACSSGTSSNEPIDPVSLFEKKCALCHGNDGKLMLAGASDLSSSSLSDEEVIAVITNGRGNMTPFRSVLTEQEISALATYVKGLRQP